MKQLQENKINNSFILAYISVLVFAPLLSHGKTFKEVVDIFTDGLADTIVQLLFILAAVCFFWGVAQYVLNPYQEGKDKGKKYILWSLIGLIVMFSIKSLINIINSTFF